MEVNHQFYSYKKHYQKLIPIISTCDSCSIYALPFVGKTRAIKKVAEMLKKTLQIYTIETINELFGSNEIPDIVVLSDLHFTDNAEFREKVQRLERFRANSIKRFSLIYYFLIDPRLSKSLSELRTISFNVVEFQCDREFSDFLFLQNTTRYEGQFIDDSVFAQAVYQLSGGNPILVKHMVMQKVSNSKYNPNTDKELEPLAEKILVQLNKTEIKILREQTLAQELFIGDVLATKLNNGILERKLKINRTRIYIGSLDVTDEFTSKELYILRYLKRNSLISRETISRLLNGKAEAAVASEAAIDKTISRIRAKLSKYKIDDLIVTVKGKGYYVEYSYWY